MFAFIKRLIEAVKTVEEHAKRIDALEREVVRLITEAKEAKQQDAGPVISRASEEGEPWIRKSHPTR